MSGEADMTKEQQQKAMKWYRFRLARRSFEADYREDDAGMAKTEWLGAGVGAVLLVIGVCLAAALAMSGNPSIGP